MRTQDMIVPSIITETSRGLESVCLSDEFFTRRKMFLISEVSAESMNSYFGAKEAMEFGLATDVVRSTKMM